MFICKKYLVNLEVLSLIGCHVADRTLTVSDYGGMNMLTEQSESGINLLLQIVSNRERIRKMSQKK